ncbi:hypothetical protein BDZ45DRAFT_356793 [Acephala macrosclerotiorum]|nr:hypothetical protein BDZ45DRAFT_356793 [Acephala macrosclerotiorum]
MRIGSAFFSREMGGQWTIAGQAPSGKPLPYWEDVFVQGQYTIRSRRKLVNPEKIIKPADVSVMDSRRKRARRSSPLTSDDDSDDTNMLDERECGDLISSAEECWSLVSSESAGSSGDEVKGTDSSAGEEAAGNSSDDDESNSNSEISHDAEDRSSSLSQRSDRSTSAAESVTSASSVGESASDHGDPGSDGDDEKSDIARYDSDSEFSGIYKFQPKIARSRTFQYRLCDLCRGDCGLDTDPRPFYQCTLCDAEGWDMCSDCFAKGEWCLKNNHQLLKMVGRKNRFLTIGTVCRNDARPGVNITVQRNRLSGTETVFRYTTTSPSLLYESPPVLHPTLPLLVYPLDGRRFLFANLVENTYFMHRISFDEAESKGSEPFAVKVVLRFSFCGKYLHIGRVSARKVECGTPTVKLFVQVFKIPLSTRQDHETKTDTASISKTFLDLRLKDEVQEIHTLDKKVALPRSARVRPIHFYPPRSKKECARIIISSMYGERPQLPIVVYLKPESMGEWVVAKEAVLSVTDEPRKREDPLLEDFDADSDCDLIMPLLDFQR